MYRGKQGGLLSSSLGNESQQKFQARVQALRFLESSPHPQVLTLSFVSPSLLAIAL